MEFILRKIQHIRAEYTIHHVVIFILTFFSYANLHLTRKAFANVKPKLFDTWTGDTSNTTHYPIHLWNDTNHQIFKTTDDATIYGGLLDLLFLLSYSIGLYINGYLGDIYDPRKVLSIGMILSSINVFLFGYICEICHYYNIYVYATLWIFNGLFQSSGWPSAVAIMANWFGHSRGIVFGIWSNCASVGNVIGDLLVGSVVVYGYQFGLTVPAAVLCSTGILLLSGIIVHPDQVPTVPKFVPIESPDIVITTEEDDDNDQSPLTPHSSANDSINQPTSSSTAGESKPLGFFRAFLIPGVIPYALAYACLKLVNYAFFFWLPFYLSNNFHWSTDKADSVSAWYDIGGIIGSVIMGLISDCLWSRSPVNMAMLFCALPSLYLYSFVPDILWQNSLAMAMTGLFINVPANIISATIAADLGDRDQLSGNDKALSTVTGIIDGTGSLGAAIGQLLVPILQTKFGWNFVFYFFIIMLACTIVCIMPVFVKDVYLRFCAAHSPSRHQL